MAATGGGKIRSRRYHIASKPYAKNKQVKQIKVFEVRTRVQGRTVTVVSPHRSSCYCFVEDISWPAVSARGLHAQLAYPRHASKVARWFIGETIHADLTGQITAHRVV